MKQNSISTALTSALAVLEALPYSAWFCTADRQVLVANDRTLESAQGKPLALRAGKPCFGAGGPGQAMHPGCPLGEAVRRGAAASHVVNDPILGEPVLMEVSPTRFSTSRGERVYLHTARPLADLPKADAAVQSAALGNQKLEVLGRLAAGVAHDFNNLLTVILNYVEWVREEFKEGDPRAEDLREVLDAASRARNLAQSLLTFGRQGPSSPEIVDLNQRIREIEPLMRKTVGTGVAIASYLDAALWNVLIDPAQLDQAILNLCVNARDAMPDGGGIVIETRNVLVNEGFLRRHPEATPGPHVLLAVSDSGCGIPEEVQSRVFEPFFTTKAPGVGTGLGLATVYGAVRQAGGFVHLYSEPGVGTTFKLYFPARDERPSAVFAPPIGRVRAEIGRGERVLIVEDDEMLRGMTARFLAKAGFRVLQAEHGDAALFLLGTVPVGVDLLLTDVVLPGMSGPELANVLRAQRPTLPVVYLSGYERGQLLEQGFIGEQDHFVSKPFAVEDLLRACRKALDGVRRGAP